MEGTKDGGVQVQERFKLVKHCSANDSTEREQQQQQCKAGSNLIRRTVNDLIRRSKSDDYSPSPARHGHPFLFPSSAVSVFLLRHFGSAGHSFRAKA